MKFTFCALVSKISIDAIGALACNTNTPLEDGLGYTFTALRLFSKIDAEPSPLITSRYPSVVSATGSLEGMPSANVAFA